jgi:predicted RNA-binding Zn-ribbon protein involved in translation (DUF1610 family)
MRWTCRRCGALLEADPVRMKLSNWADTAVWWALLAWGIFGSNADWMSFVSLAAAVWILSALIEFGGRAIRLVHCERSRIESESGDLDDDRRGTTSVAAGRIKHHGCPNCGQFVWSSWRWSWTRGVTTRSSCPRCGILLQSDPERNAICAWILSAVLLLWLLISLEFDSSFWYGASFSSVVAGFVIVSTALCVAVTGVQLARTEKLVSPMRQTTPLPTRSPVGAETAARSRKDG